MAAAHSKDAWPNEVERGSGAFATGTIPRDDLDGDRARDAGGDASDGDRRTSLVLDGEDALRACANVGDEAERTKLMTDITRLLREPTIPETARTAGLTLIGWLARRMPGESPHTLGVAEARESERRVKTARKR